jgi:signal transduction histidine kinase
LERVKLDWGAVVQEVTVLASRSGRGFGDVRVECEVPEAVAVEADPGMLRQLLWNLVRNAVQASAPGGVVRIVLRKAEGGAAVLDVVDHGAGIQPAARSQLFDPFFTTRSQGTGIGLAVVKRIVDEHGWRVGVSDTDGGGATFSVSVPLSAQEPGNFSGSPDLLRW